MSQVKDIDGYWRFRCPHCSQELEVHKSETNCCIFRCGLYKSNKLQIPPHTIENECDRLRNQKLIYGCARPFKFVYSDLGNYVEKCGYI